MRGIHIRNAQSVLTTPTFNALWITYGTCQSGLGWYAHSSTKESIVIAMPESELPALGVMEDDAERWIQDEIAANRPDRGPIGNADIVNVLVTVKTVGGRSDWVVLACGIASILVVFGLACVINAICEIITEWCRLRRLRHSLHTAGQEKAYGGQNENQSDY